MTARQYGFAFSSLLIALALIYHNSWHGGWQYDDNVNIVENPNVHLHSLTWAGIRRAFSGIDPGNRLDNRPLSYLTFALNHAAGKLRVEGYHLVNFSIHVSAAAILFLFILETLRLPVHRGRYHENAYSMALLSVFLWALHPIQVTAVTYIVQRMASMAALFYILAMYCYLRGRSTRFPFRKTLWFLGCGLSGLLSLGSKEIAAMLPVSLILYEWLLLHNPEKPPTAAASFRKPLLLVLLAALGILAFLFGDWHGWMEAYRGRPFTLHQRLLTEPRVFVFYISLLLYPTSSRLSLLHDIEISRNALEPWTTLPAILICIGLGAAAGCLRRRHPLIAYCLLFFLLNHLIEGSIIPLELIFEHRNYLPSMLFFLPLAILFFLVRRHLAHRPALEYLFFLLPAMWLFSNGHTVYMRNRLFLDETAFWQDIVRKAPRLSISHLNLGKCYWNTGFFQKAMDEYLTAAKLNRFMHRDQAGMLFYNAGLYQAYYANDYRTALRLFVKALETHSGHQEIWYEIIRLNALMGNRKQALRHADQALRHWPEEPALLSAASVVYFQEGDLEKALTLARKARETEPQSVAALGTMAEIFRVKGQPELAVFYWEQVAVLEPDNLGAVLALIELSVGLADEQSQDKWVGTLERHACWKKSIAPRQCLEAFQRNGLLTAYKPDAAVISAAVHDTRTRNHRAPS